MKFKEKEKELISLLCMSASILCVALAGVGFLWKDIWFASTQWMLTAAVFGLFGVYLKLDRE
jgi:hypothetical protein